MSNETKNADQPPEDEQQAETNVIDIPHFIRQSSPHKLDEIRKAMPELEARLRMKDDAAETYKDLVKLVSLKANVDAGAISSFVSAIVHEKKTKTRAKAEQLQLLFEEIEA